MKLIHKPIPEQFLTALPEGIKFVRHHGQDFLVIENIYCTEGHDLMAETVRVHNEPSVRFKLQVGQSRGMVFVDAFWGGHAKLYGFIPDIHSEGPAVRAFCPVCETDLTVADCCQEKDCNAERAIRFNLPGGDNFIYVCAKLGCPGHRMEIAKMPAQIAEEVSYINFFGAQADDILMDI